MSFMEPFSQQEAETCFQKVIAGLAARDRILLGAFGSGDDAGDLWGTVQILTVMPPNQSHRTDIAKLLVHRAARGQGIGEALMRAAEDHARQPGNPCWSWTPLLAGLPNVSTKNLAGAKPASFQTMRTIPTARGATLPSSGNHCSQPRTLAK